MKYYINKQQEIFAYELDGSQDHLIDDKEPITIEEVQAISKAKEDAYKATMEYKINEAKSYLSSTDWYTSRLSETGKAIPEDVLAQRTKAREFLSDNDK